MKIAKNTRYGNPSTIQIIDLPTPSIKPDEILVKVEYSTVNKTDVGFLYGKPFVARLVSGLTKPRYPALGCEFSGVVAQVGDGVTEFSIADKVFGYDDSGAGFGAHAEYKVMKSAGMVASIPENVSFTQAAASTEGAHYALSFMNKVTLKQGDKVFVHGATGAIGSAMAQLLVARGVDVTASGPTDQLKTVEKLGVANVIDWQAGPLDSLNERFDYFFDAVGKSSFATARKILKPNGTYISSELGENGENIWLPLINLIQRLFTKRNIIFPIPSRDEALLVEIRHRLDTGEFKPLIDREYALDDIKQAYQYVETGQKIGNVLIRVARASRSSKT